MKCLSALVLMLVLLCGCQEEGTDVTFIVVNGTPITASWVKDSVLIEGRIAELAGRPVKSEDFVQWANARAMKMIGPMVNNVLLDQEFERAAIQVSPEDVANALASYNQRTRRQASSAEELSALFGDQAAAFRRQFESVTRAAAYERQRWQPKVREEMVDAFIEGVSNDFRRASEADAAAWAKAKAAHARLKAGEAWDKVAAACSEDKLISSTRERFAREWTWVNGDAMGIEPLAAALPTLKKGGFTEPFESPDGLQIVRLIEKNKTLYKLSRIFFRMAQPVHPPANREEAREAVRRNLADARRAATLERLQRTAKFAYPMGTNITYKIWENREPAKEGPKGR